MDTANYQPTNLGLIEVPKVFKPTNERSVYTSIIYSPKSNYDLWHVNVQTLLGLENRDSLND